MFVSLTSKEFREQVQRLKLDRKRRTRSARKVGGRGETSHVTLKWEGGYGVGGRRRRKIQYSPILLKPILFFFFLKKKSQGHIARNLSSFSLVPPLL